MVRSWGNRCVVACSVVALHALILLTQRDDSSIAGLRPEPLAVIATIIRPYRAPLKGAIPVPDLYVPAPDIEVPHISVSFEDPDADVVEGVIGSVSVPRPDISSSVDSNVYAQRAGLQPGESAVTVLTVEVL